MAERYVHETIKNIDISVPDEYGDDQRNRVKDPIEETEVAIEITINRYTTTQSSSSPAAADADAEEEELDDTTNHLYLLDGFLGDYVGRWDELNQLVENKTVTAGTLKEIKKNIMRNSSRIKEIAWQLKPEAIGIDMTLDLLTWYSDDQEDVVSKEMVDDDEEEMSDQDDDVDDDDGVEEEEEEEEEMIDIEDEEDDNNEVKKPALRSSVEALETRTFEKIEDLELMLKSTSCGCRSCGVCLDEFSIDVAAGGISIKTMPCLHIFHTGCIERWLEKTYTCPICRYKMPTAAH